MRNIDWEKPLSQDDRAWLDQRLTPELVEKIDANDKRFGKAGSSDDKSSAFEDDYDKWKVDELKVEAEKRKIDLTGITKKPELVAALRSWDAENPDDDE